MAEVTAVKEHKIKSDIFPQIISGYAHLKYLFAFKAGPNSETDAWRFFKNIYIYLEILINFVWKQMFVDKSAFLLFTHIPPEKSV